MNEHETTAGLGRTVSEHEMTAGVRRGLSSGLEPTPGVRRPLSGRVVLLLLMAALVPRLFVAWTLPLAASPAAPECAPDEGLQFWTVMRYAAGDFATWPASGSIYSAFPPLPY